MTKQMCKMFLRVFSSIHGDEVIALEQPIDISDDEKLGPVCYHFEFQSVYIEIRLGDDDSVQWAHKS